MARKYELEIMQYVFYIGEGKAMIIYKLNHKNVDFKFEVINIQDFDYKDFLNSDKPEEVILAVLADFGKEKPESVIEKVLEKLKSLPIETLKYRKSVIQLDVLSNLRDFQPQFIKQLLDIAFTYDIEKDLRFKEGKRRGELKGELKTKIQAVKTMLKNGLAIKDIAIYLDVSIEFVENIQKDNK